MGQHRAPEVLMCVMAWGLETQAAVTYSRQAPQQQHLPLCEGNFLGCQVQSVNLGAKHQQDTQSAGLVFRMVVVIRKPSFCTRVWHE